MSIGYQLFTPAYVSAKNLGMATNYIVSGLCICPAIIADWLYNHLQSCLNLPHHKNHTDCDIRIYDVPHIIQFEEIKSVPIYKGGFFTAAKPQKICAEIIGAIANAIVAATTFILVGLLEIALLAAATPIIIMLGVAATFAGGIYCLLQSYDKGFQKQSIDTINFLSEHCL